MEILKFKLSGKTAFFKRPDVNTYYYFTYGQIHKVALLGLFGAILGYKGYNAMQKKDEYPEFYSKLQHIKISLVPYGEKGCFTKKIQRFNNSVGYASKEQGGNLIVKEQWLENPMWEVYVLIDSEVAETLAETICAQKCEYVPYLGKNDHPANITEVLRVKDVKVITKPITIESFMLKENVKLDIEDDEAEVDNPYKYEESLPVALNENNMYILQELILSNMIVVDKKCDVYQVNNKNIVFF